jgi:hypothetical protein
MKAQGNYREFNSTKVVDGQVGKSWGRTWVACKNPEFYVTEDAITVALTLEEVEILKELEANVIEDEEE